jgi:hypothetical protein
MMRDHARLRQRAHHMKSKPSAAGTCTDLHPAGALETEGVA